MLFSRLIATFATLVAVSFVSNGFAVQTLPNSDVFCLTEYTDVWYSHNTSGVFAAPVQTRFLGFGDTSYIGDFNGDGLTDFATLASGEFWWAINDAGGSFVEPSKMLNSTYLDNDLPSSNYRNEYLVGDFNNDTLTDVMGISKVGKIYVAWNNGSGLDSFQLIQTGGPQHSVFSIIHSTGIDLNNDGLDDLVTVSDERYVAIRQSTGSGFLAATTHECGPRSHSSIPNSTDDLRVVFGDFNGDGYMDACQVDGTVNNSTAYVSLNGVSGLQPYAVWAASTGFHRTTTWQVFAMDVNQDGNDDLVQLNDIGELWAALSNGTNGFGSPSKVAVLGFRGDWLNVTGRDQ